MSDGLIGTFWIGKPGGPRRSVPVYEIVDVRPSAQPDILGERPILVYAKRLDAGNRSTHPQGAVKPLGRLGVFGLFGTFRQVSKDEAEAAIRAHPR